MKQKIQLMSLLVLFYASSFAQVTILQQKVAGGSQVEILAASFQTKDSGLIAGGSSNSPVSGDKTEASKGGTDYWVIKYDKTGAVVWDKTFGGDKNDLLIRIKQTKDGGYILAGTSGSGISGDKTEASRDKSGLTTGGDFWLVKIDANGNKQWDKTFGGDLIDSLTSIQQTSDAGYIVGGYSTSSASGDKTEASRGLQDYWVIKIDKNGVKQWDKIYGGTKIDRLASVRETADGGYIAGGTSESGIGNEKTEAGYGKSDYWVLKLTGTGDVQWDRTAGGSAADILSIVEPTADGGYFLAGSSNSTISGLKSQRNRGTYPTFDYWVVRLNASGDFRNDRTFGGSNDDILTFASQTSDKGYVLCGYSNSSKSGEKSEDSRGGVDYWMVKQYGGDSSRIFNEKTMGGAEDDFASSIIESATPREFWFGGYSSSDVSGDKTESSRGKSDFWMVYMKIEQVLPVSFTNLKAFQQGSGVKVLWTSLSEINVAKYEIQRSSDAVNFKTAGTINPTSNAAKQVDYDFFDQHPVNGSNYYRIKATDLDGKETYTSTALVVIKGKAAIVIYPNPVKDMLNVQVAGKVSLSLINQNGVVVLSKTIENSGAINVTHLPAGIYYLRNNLTGDKTQVVIGR